MEFRSVFCFDGGDSGNLLSISGDAGSDGFEFISKGFSGLNQVNSSVMSSNGVLGNFLGDLGFAAWDFSW
jgi:hypothetical protein